MLAVLSHGDLIFQGILAVVAVVLFLIAAFYFRPFAWHTLVAVGFALLAIITAWTLFATAG